MRGNGQNNFLLNGVDNNVNTIDFLNQTSYSVGPSVEAIGEMSVQTNGVNAEYGRAAGAVINVNLKSGTNQLHGSLFEILQNKDLNANSWTNNQAGKPRGPYVQNQFGATAGGPSSGINYSSSAITRAPHCFVRRHPGPRLQQQ